MATPTRCCQTCRFYEQSPLPGKGWCRNSIFYAPHHQHLVDARSIDCQRTYGDFWQARSEVSVPVAAAVASASETDPTPPAGEPVVAAGGAALGGSAAATPLPEPADRRRRGALWIGLVPAALLLLVLALGGLWLSGRGGDRPVLADAGGAAETRRTTTPVVAEARLTTPTAVASGASVKPTVGSGGAGPVAPTAAGASGAATPASAGTGTGPGSASTPASGAPAVGGNPPPATMTSAPAPAAPPPPPAPSATPEPAPTATPPPVPTATTAPAPPPAAPPAAPPAPPRPAPAGLRVGGTATVATGSATLRLRVRNAPNLNGTIIGRLPTGSRVTITGGPRAGGGETWWEIQGGGVSGWAAGSFLVP